MKFKTKNPHFKYLHQKWSAKNSEVNRSFLDSHESTLKHLTLGGLGGLMLLSSPAVGGLPIPPTYQLAQSDNLEEQNSQQSLVQNLGRVLPPEVRKLTPEEEDKVSNLLSKEFGVKVSAELQGVRLNRSYGLIGGEQHLYRYPGDNLFKHADSTADWLMYGGAGIAPGLGAWGYFAPSKSEFTYLDKERERWYIAVQTFLAPGFAENVKYYRDFFRFREMLVVNPKTGQAVVADIGDAGPSEWTGKHLGGSPEVMHHLGLSIGPRKGAVLYFFIDDPDEIVPLGPVTPIVGDNYIKT